MQDIVFPKGNEREFLRIAEQLGIDRLTFVYSNKKDFFKHDKVDNALFVEPKRVSAAHSVNALAVCSCSREAIERGAGVVIAAEENPSNDKTHYRVSGLNHVLCRLANQKNVRVGFDTSLLLTSTFGRRALYLGRMMQNARLCSKFKVPVRVASFARTPWQMRSKSELASLYGLIGLPQKFITAGLQGP